MRLLRVLGPVWGSRHAEGLTGEKVLALSPSKEDTAEESVVTAIDRLGAGPGEWVLVAHGSRVRDLTLGATIPEKDVVIAIVDGIDPP